jgi:hypothetical protein
MQIRDFGKLFPWLNSTVLAHSTPSVRSFWCECSPDEKSILRVFSESETAKSPKNVHEVRIFKIRPKKLTHERRRRSKNKKKTKSCLWRREEVGAGRKCVESRWVGGCEEALLRTLAFCGMREGSGACWVECGGGREESKAALWRTSAVCHRDECRCWCERRWRNKQSGIALVCQDCFLWFLYFLANASVASAQYLVHFKPA